jgi:hypothetical protein
MAESPAYAIPREVLDAMVAFIRAGRTGEIVLRVVQGRVRGVRFATDFRERDFPAIVPATK